MRPGWIPLLFLALATGGCQSLYYDLMEEFGKQKRHILADRVEASRADQRVAQEQFQTTLERFKAAADFDGGDLEDLYTELSAQLDDCEARADQVRSRIASIEDVAEDLFAEWQKELDEISNRDLRSRSAESLKQTQRRYEQLIAAMRRAESKMDPVLVAFRDQVLFLKHNLNARAIQSLQGSVVSIESDVTALVADMEAAIREAESFLAGFETG